MISLSISERKTVEDILKTYATDQPYRVIIFGSRATGKARKYSDVDVALMGTSTISPRVSAALAEAFEDSSLPYTVDIIDGMNASSQLLTQIRQHGEELVQL
jgi:predicted nucleotidyltransferase